MVQLTRKASAKIRVLIFIAVCAFDGLEMFLGYILPGFGNMQTAVSLVAGVLPYFVVGAGLGNVTPGNIVRTPLFGLRVRLFVVIPDK